MLYGKPTTPYPAHREPPAPPSALPGILEHLGTMRPATPEQREILMEAFDAAITRMKAERGGFGEAREALEDLMDHSFLPSALRLAAARVLAEQGPKTGNDRNLLNLFESVAQREQDPVLKAGFSEATETLRAGQFEKLKETSARLKSVGPKPNK